MRRYHEQGYLENEMSAVLQEALADLWRDKPDKPLVRLCAAAHLSQSAWGPHETRRCARAAHALYSCRASHILSFGPCGDPQAFLGRWMLNKAAEELVPDLRTMPVRDQATL